MDGRRYDPVPTKGSCREMQEHMLGKTRLTPPLSMFFAFLLVGAGWAALVSDLLHWLI